MNVLHRNVLRGALCLGVLTASVAQLSATTFYVDQTRGNDRAGGTSQQAAWQHLSAVTRYAQQRGFRPGDVILLKAGERWREELDLTDVHGKQGSPVRVGSYGTGDYPTIDGADLVTGWRAVQNGVFQAPASVDIYKLFVDGNDRPTAALQPVFNGVGDFRPGQSYQIWDQVQVPGKAFVALRVPVDQKHLGPADWFHLAPADSAPQADGLTNVSQTAGSWWYDARGKRVLVHLADGGTPASHTVQVTMRRYGIRLQGSSYVVIDGLRVIHAAKSGITGVVADTPLADPSQDNQFNTVQNCIIWNVGDTTSDFSPAMNIGGEGGIYVTAGSAAGRPSLAGWVLKDNAIGIIDSVRKLMYERDGILISGTTGASVDNNYIATANALGLSAVSDRGAACSTPEISRNYLTNNDGNMRISGCLQAMIRDNTIEYSYGYGIQVGGNSSTPNIINNTIHHIERLGQENAYNGVDCNGGAPGGMMRGNRISAVWGAEATFEMGCSNWTVENNVFDSSNNMKGGGLTLYIRRESAPGLQFRNNTYRLNASTNRQFNYGAGQPGGLTFHDFNWWQQTVEGNAQASQPVAAAMVRTAEAVTRSPAAASYLKVAPPTNWQP